MILTWFTTATGASEDAFSSFYRYDTDTRNFVRIRLELGKPHEGVDCGTTRAYFRRIRYVGFGDISPEFYSRRKEEWSIDENGNLCCQGAPLSSMPRVGTQVFETSFDKFGFEHAVYEGGQVTEHPNLPAGISPQHLALIANHVALSGRSIRFTNSTASQAVLSERLKSTVCEIIRQTDFRKITTKVIHDKIREQTETLKMIALKPVRKAIDGSLAKIRNMADEFKQRIEAGMLPYDRHVASALDSLLHPLEHAESALQKGDGLGIAVREIAMEKGWFLSVVGLPKHAGRYESEAIMKELNAVVMQLQADAKCWRNIEKKYCEAQRVAGSSGMAVPQVRGDYLTPQQPRQARMFINRSASVGTRL